MQALTKTKEIIQLFLANTLNYEDIDEKKLEINYGLRLVDLKKSKDDKRDEFEKNEGKKWHLNQMLTWGSPYIPTNGIASRWDISTDATVVSFRYSYADFYYYRLEQLTKEEIISITENKKIEDEIKSERLRIRDLLTSVLIQKMYPFGNLESRELETQFGVHLKQIQRDEHRFMKYTPSNQCGVGWMVGKPLNWGSSNGWDITRDGKIACCRINYDDYINFEIEILSEKEIEDYKTKFSKPNNQLINRLATLKEMLNQLLITEDEFQTKKQEILNLI
jgi:hypothetical protein